MIKRVLTYTVVIATVVWSVGILSMPLAVGAAVSGDLIKLQCAAGAGVNDPCKAVYYLGADGKRYVFPNEKTYKTWYPDFSGVQIVSSTEMSSYTIGGNVTYRPGVKLVKINTDPKVYAVAANGTLRWVTTAALAVELYGASWATTSVEDVSDAFFVNYTVGADITAASQYDKATETANASSINDDKNLGGSQTGGTGLTVALAADTPASGVVVSNAARVPFTKINLTASADGDITIDSWVVKRTGLAQNGSFTSIDIVDAATLLPINETGKTFSSENTANFTEDFVIPAGTTKSVYLAGNMGTIGLTYAGETPSLTLQSLVLKGTGSVIGSLPITGNYQNLNGTITIGSATVSRGAYTNATDTSLEVGTANYTFFSFKIQNGSTEEITFSQVKAYQKGSASLSTDLSKLALYEDGTKLADGVVSGNYVSFSFPAITLTKGQTKQYQVKGDVASGSARVIELGIYRTTDLLVKGLTYGYNITPTYSSTGAATGSNPVLQDNEFTIAGGTLRVGRSSTVGAGNISLGSDQTLGAFEFEAKGEPVVISALTLEITSTTSGTLTATAGRAYKLLDAAGKVVAGPTDLGTNKKVAFTDTFTIPVGMSHYKVVGTLDLNGGWVTTDTIYAGINTPSSAVTAKGDVTGLGITADPASNITTATQTIKAANVTVVKNSTPTNKTVIVNSSAVLIGSWTFDASNSGEDIRITSLGIRASTTGKLNNLTLKDGSTALSPVNNAPTANANTTSTFALGTPIIVTKGTSKVISLYADIGSNASTGEVDAWGITCGDGVTAYGKTTGNAATVTVTSSNGALITVGAAGTLTINEDGSSLQTRLVVAGTSAESLAELRLKATNESIDITKLTVNIADAGLAGTGSGTYAEIAKLYLKKDGAIVGDTAGYSVGSANKQIDLERGQLTVPTGDTGIKLSILTDLVEIGTDLPGTDNVDIQVGIDATGAPAGLTATGNGSNSAASVTFTDATGSAVIIHKAVPQLVVNDLPTGNKLTGAEALLYRVSITAVGGNIGIWSMSYHTTTTTGVNMTNAYTKLSSCSGNCGGVISGSQLTDVNAAGAKLVSVGAVGTSDRLWNMNIDNSQSHGKYYLPIIKNSTAVVDFIANVALSTNANDTVSTRMLGSRATSTLDVAGDYATTAEWNQTADYPNSMFIWSPLDNDDSNSAAALQTTRQWYNGYLVSGLGTTVSSTLIRSVSE